MKIARDRHSDIVDAYTIELLPMQDIANILHVSRTTVHKILRAHGVDTAKHKIPVSCTACGAAIARTRKRVKTQHNHFCNRECYESYLDAGKTNCTHKQRSQRISRAVVSRYITLAPEHVVHHEDRNDYNNRLDNLRVFATHGDHIRYHHYNRDRYHNAIVKTVKRSAPIYNEIKPVWDGRSVGVFAI